MNGLDGNDAIQLKTVKISTVLDGGPGDDTVSGGSGNDLLTGSFGNDVLDGGPGIDRLVESADVSFMFLEQDWTKPNGTLRGGLGDDVLLGNRIEEADLTGGPSDNRIDASLFRGRTWLRGLGGDDILRGGSAADVLLGGDGNDGLYGGPGRDILIGGAGQDAITGGAADDIVIGGFTDYDGNPVALAAIQAEWLSTSAYSTRVKHLLGTLPHGKNASYALNAATVTDLEGTTSGLTGGTGMDFYIVHSADVTDRVGAEQLLTV